MARIAEPRTTAEISGLDALETRVQPRVSFGRRAWNGMWPKLIAVAIALLAWQIVVWSRWRPQTKLPGPVPVFKRLVTDLAHGPMLQALGNTLERAAIGYSIAIVIGMLLGVSVARSRIMRAAIGSLITGVLTMPSIAWFPLAILLFRPTEPAIIFVVVLGAAPAIANGLYSGIDHIPPILLRAGRVLGARNFNEWRHVIFPAAMPGIVAGLKQGWAFAWRSLMAGELIVVIASKPSIGARLQIAKQHNDATGLIAAMIVILVIGIVIDSFVFGSIERAVRKRRGLLETL
ncbi:MAG: ABC transporter permease [Actinomycetota bacterium]